jgi:hypothetical protein
MMCPPYDSFTKGGHGFNKDEAIIYPEKTNDNTNRIAMLSVVRICMKVATNELNGCVTRPLK